LTLKGYKTTAIPTLTISTYDELRLGGENATNKTRNAQYKEFKIWYSAEVPE
jgi:hypothetical protein